MPDRYLLGIDSGLTVTKAVVFDLAGRALGLGRCEITTHKPKPRHVERDMGEHWQATCRAIRQALIQATVPPDRIAAIGITGHGDGVYPVTATGEPNGPAMLSLDSALPVAAPSLVGAVLFTFVITWNELLIALALTSRNVTLPVVAAGFTTLGMEVPWGVINASSVVLALPPLILVGLIMRFIDRYFSRPAR